MSFANIKQVLEERDPASVNQRLTEGWELLAVVQGSDPLSGQSFPYYVLGQSGRIEEEAMRLLQERRDSIQNS